MFGRVCILGAGQMGLVMADAVAARGVSVALWGRPAPGMEVLSGERTSPRLPGFLLPEAVEVTIEAGEALEGAECIVNAIPTQFIRGAWQPLKGSVPPGAAVVSVSKGIENGTLLPPLGVIAQVMGDDPQAPARPMGVLSGPTIAAELARHLPGTMVAASADPETARRIQEVCGADWLRVYRHDDPLGVELAGALKNVVALAAGMVDGLGAGDNAKSALLARGLAEIARLGVALGARVETFFGVAGVGDLATTCFSPEGRNRSCGERIGRGEALEAILQTTTHVVEGVATTRSVVELAQRHGVEMPITGAVHAILFQGLAPAEAIRSLMSRAPKAEQIG